MFGSRGEIAAVDPVLEAVVGFLSAHRDGWRDLDHETVSDSQILALNRLAAARFIAIRQAVDATFQEHAVAAVFRCSGDLWRKQLGYEIKARLRAIQANVEWTVQQRLAGYRLTLDGEKLSEDVRRREIPPTLVDLLYRSGDYAELQFGPEIACESWEHAVGQTASAAAAAQAIASPTINNEISLTVPSSPPAPAKDPSRSGNGAHEEHQHNPPHRNYGTVWGQVHKLLDVQERELADRDAFVASYNQRWANKPNPDSSTKVQCGRLTKAKLGEIIRSRRK